MGKKTKLKSYFLFLGLMVALLPLGASFGFSSKKVESPVWVIKDDGAESCLPQSGVSLTVGAEELKGAHVSVLDSRKGSDKKMHIQMCGALKGTTNSFLIPREHLPAAMALGYKEAPLSVEK